MRIIVSFLLDTGIAKMNKSQMYFYRAQIYNNAYQSTYLATKHRQQYIKILGEGKHTKKVVFKLDLLDSSGLELGVKRDYSRDECSFQSENTEK